MLILYLFYYIFLYLYLVLGRCLPHVFFDATQSMENLKKGSNMSLGHLISVLGDDNGVVPSDKAISNSGRLIF